MSDDTKQSMPMGPNQGGAQNQDNQPEPLTLDFGQPIQPHEAPQNEDPWFHGGGNNLGNFSDLNIFETALQQAGPAKKSVSPKIIGVAVLLLVLGAAGFMFQDDIMSLLGMGSGDDDIAMFEVEEAPVARPAIKQEKPVPQPQIDEVAETADEEVVMEDNQDDFAGVSEEFLLPEYTPIQQMGDAERQMYLDMLNHRYIYQRYKATVELRQRKLGGSDTLLTQALDQPKFWTRMEAVFALAEMGIDVRSEHVKKAIGDARPYLVKNYFKRFKKASTPGERYIMALAMFFVSEDAQIVIGAALQPYREAAYIN